MIIDYSVINPNLNRVYYGLGFITTWNTRDSIAVISFLGKAVVTDAAVGVSVVTDAAIGGATVVDKTNE